MYFFTIITMYPEYLIYNHPIYDEYFDDETIDDHLSIFFWDFDNILQDILLHSENIGYIYIIHAKETTRFKIGRTSNIKRRLKELTYQSPYQLVLYYYYPSFDTVFDEKNLHSLLKSYRKHGEWFDLISTQSQNTLYEFLFQDQSKLSKLGYKSAAKYLCSTKLSNIIAHRLLTSYPSPRNNWITGIRDNYYKNVSVSQRFYECKEYKLFEFNYAEYLEASEYNELYRYLCNKIDVFSNEIMQDLIVLIEQIILYTYVKSLNFGRDFFEYLVIDIFKTFIIDIIKSISNLFLNEITMEAYYNYTLHLIRKEILLYKTNIDLPNTTLKTEDLKNISKKVQI